MLAQHTQWQDQMLGRYRLQRLLGRGGMGEVWLAEDTDLQRQVAVKLLSPVFRSQQTYFQAFNREARLVASLEHPHILSVHDFGEFELAEDVITYLIMPLISGGSLESLLREQEQPLPRSIALRYLRQAAEAIDFAHSKRILHRDIKLANMLLQDHWLFISDFGIATLLTTQAFRSQTKAGAGTPLYMAPEQSLGKALPASDRYSLAVVAYKLLTGHVPFDGDSPFAVALKHIQDVPPSPRQFNPELSQDIEHVLLRGLAKDPDQRPASCVAFVDELERLHHPPHLVPRVENDPASTLIKPMDELHSARRSSPPQETSQAGEVSPRDRSRSQNANSVGDQAAQEQLATTAGAHRPLSRRSLLLGGAAATILLAGGGYALANAYQPEATPRRGPQRLIPGIPRLKFTGHADGVNNVCWNPQGRFLASGGLDTRIMVWDPTSILQTPTKTTRSVTQPAAQWKLFAENYRHDLGWSPDGRFLVTAPHERGASVTYIFSRTVATIDVFTPQARIALNSDRSGNYDTIDEVSSPAWSPDGKSIATATDQNQVVFWNAPGPNKGRGIIKLFNNSVTSTKDYYEISVIRWSLDGSLLLGLDNKFHLLAWDPQTGKQQVFPLPDRSAELKVWAQTHQTLNMRSLATSLALPHQILVDAFDVAAIFDLQQHKIVTLLTVADPVLKGLLQVSKLAWSSNGRYVAGCYLGSNQIYIWDLANSRSRKTSNGFKLPDLSFGKNNGHSSDIFDLSWSPDGRFLASASADHSVIIWQVDAE
ncbi:hypothetical protein KSD_45700 [Ktedonobacter sp. SOSP1-85]|uniref:WD40 repeat domain-containing serine/threonine protein kinase n=1 Tax=Ktedonobacter sp. SOSP1-85 TaxID=2778367 RepID=UPI0019153B4B|nr:serine/threonine-protein kinase [Ktedonobacter sp. SOSP1-85]GHO76799.1 hypothetical protein KSD_45700 [Ktedonobacter sp. SOSP1-85]